MMIILKMMEVLSTQQALVHEYDPDSHTRFMA